MAHFGRNSNNTYQLLTPSAFEITQTSDVHKQLSNVVAEIEKLKLENELLQKQKNKQVDKMNIPPVQAPAHYLSQKDSIVSDECHEPYLPSYVQPQLPMESLITHQAAEIAELRQKVYQLTADHVIELKLLKDEHQKEKQKILDEHWTEINNLKYCHREEKTKLNQDALQNKQQNENLIIGLESELKHKEKMYETQVAILSQNHESEVKILQKLIENLKKEVNDLKNNKEVELLEQNVDDLKKQSECQILQLQQELNLKTTEAENQLKQIAQLKMYIGESENIPKSVEILKTENNCLKDKLNVCITEKDHMQSNIELLNIRLSSMVEILSLQEAELSQETFGEQNKEKQENLLLKRWREKVFAFLVQQKSDRIVLKNAENNWKNKISRMQSQLESAGNQIKILRHSLSDKQAQLDISNNNNHKLQNDLLVRKQRLDLLSNQSKKDQEIMLALKNFTLIIGSKFQDQLHCLEIINKQLASFGQRITFAGSRVLLLQNIISKQKYMSKLQQQHQTENLVNSTDESESRLTEDYVPMHAKNELLRLQKERDLLALKLTEVMQDVEERIKAKENKYKEKEIYLKKELEEAQNSLKASSDKYQSVALQYQEMQRRFEEKNNEVEFLKINFTEQKVAAKETLDKLEEKHNKALVMQFTEMDKKVNDAYRQHMKAEISLRHAKRQQEREQTCNTEQQKMMEEHFQCQIMEMHNQLHAVESERNLMMTTLQQEGLIGKLKCLPLQKDITSAENRTTTAYFTDICNLDDKGTPIEVLMKDIKQISTTILEDSSDESLS